MKKAFIVAAVAVALTIPCALASAGEVHEAAKAGDVAKLKELLDKDPGLLYVLDDQGKTPLHWSLQRLRRCTRQSSPHRT